MLEMLTGKLWFYPMVCVSTNHFLFSQPLRFGTLGYIIFIISVHLYCYFTKPSAESDFSCGLFIEQWTGRDSARTELISCLLSESRMMKILRWALMLSSQSLRFGTPRYIIFTAVLAESPLRDSYVCNSIILPF